VNLSAIPVSKENRRSAPITAGSKVKFSVTIKVTRGDREKLKALTNTLARRGLKGAIPVSEKYKDGVHCTALPS